MSSPRVVVVGAGHLGSFHLEKMAILQQEGLAQLAGVVDLDPKVGQATAQKYAIPAAQSIGELKVEADAAIVATPTVTHLQIATEALERGWHVLVEKPIASTVAEASALVEVAAQHQCLLQVGHTERFNPAIAAALAVADRPRYLVAERLGPFSGRSTDIDVVLDLMIHDLDIVASLIPSHLVETRAIGVPVLTSEIDMASARLAFADGSVAQLSAGRASLEPSRKIRMFTLERYVSIDCGSQEVKSVRRLPPLPDSPWPQIAGEPVEVQPGDALLLQDRDFLRCVSSGASPRVDGNAGLRALRLAEAVKKEMSVPIPEGMAPDA